MRGGKTVALDGLDLEVPRGGVFGFLGPNGSGKTTTIRCLLGLVSATAGECDLMGAKVPGDLSRVMPKVGSIVEAPALFPTFSGRRNLELLARTYGIDGPRIDAVLETVDLAMRQRDIVKNYSLGMKQRLGIAAALLKDPELLILDEPANGLDPAGIREVRELVRRLGAEGRTVFVSSHILSEVQQTCDRVAILARGRCVTEGPVKDVLAKGRTGAMLVRVEDGGRAVEVLRAAGMEATEVDGIVRALVPPEEGARISRALAAQGMFPSELRPDEIDLETVFLELTEKDPA